MSERRERIHAAHKLPKRRRCELLEVARSTAYYRPTPISEDDLRLMRLIDETHLELRFTEVVVSPMSWRHGVTAPVASAYNV